MASSIVVDLLMRTGSFETDTKRAEKRLQSFEREAKKVGRAIGVAFAAGAAALTAMTVATVRSAEEITRLSSLAGVGADEFQRYAAAASLAGVEQDKLADIFKDTQDKVGDFLQTGAGPLADFFENIAPQVGVTAEQFRKLSGPQALELYVDSLEAANLSQSEMVFFMEAIASDATLLLPLLRDNAEGFRLIGDAAAAAGGMMGDELLRDVTELQAASFLLQQQWQGLQTDVAGPLISTLVDLGGALADNTADTAAASLLAEDLAGALRFVGATAVGAVAAFSLTTKALKGYLDAFEAAEIGLLEAVTPGLALARIIQNRDEITAALNAGAADLDETMQGYGRIISDMWDAGDGTSGADDLIQDIADVMDAARELRNELGRDRGRDVASSADLPGRRGMLSEMVGAGGADEILRDLEVTIGGFDAAAAAVDRTRTQVERLEREIADVGALMEGGFLREEQGAEVIGRLEEDLDEAKARIQETGGEINQFMIEASRNTQNIISDALLSGFDEGVSGMLGSFGDMLERMAAEAIAANIAGAIFGEAGVGSGGGLIGSIFGGGRAGGGSVAGGMIYRVNEVNQEFFRPNTSGQVMPLGGGGGVELHIHNEGNPLAVERTQTGRGADGRQLVQAWVRSEVQGMIGRGELDRSMTSNFGVRRRPG